MFNSGLQLEPKYSGDGADIYLYLLVLESHMFKHQPFLTRYAFHTEARLEDSSDVNMTVFRGPCF